MNLISNPNPQAAIMEMAKRDPRGYSYAMGLIAQNGGDARRAFYALAKEKGIDPDQFLRTLR